MNEELRRDIEAVLNLFVRPQLAGHGGGLEVLDLDEDGTLWVEMQGQCSGCPSADETAKNLVADALTGRIPQVKTVEIDSGITDEMMADAMRLMTGRNRR